MTKELTLKELNSIAAQSCSEDFSLFVKTFWSEIIPDKLEWNWHMQVLCDELQEAYTRVFNREPKLHDLIINIPPGTSKSTICTVMAQGWSWTRDASLRHITGSYSEGLSIGHSVQMRNLVTSGLYKAFYPHIKLKPDENNKTDFRNTRNGQRFTTSVDGTVTGTHGHIITIDDPLSPKEAASEKGLQNANDWLDKTLSSRKVNKAITLTVIIMQRLHMNDCTGHLLAKGLPIRHINLPAELSKDVIPEYLKEHYTDGLLDTNRLSRQSLHEAKVSLGTAGYSTQYMQRPVPEGGLIWQKWFNLVPDHLFPNNQYLNSVSSFWDTAYTEKESNAASCYITAGVSPEDGSIWISDIGWRWLEFPELIKWMKQQVSPHRIEAKATGKSLKQVLTREGISAIEMEVKGGDKVARAHNATPVAEAGRVYIKQSLADGLYNDPKQGILHFPNGVCADLADTLAMCLQYYGGMTAGQMGMSTGAETSNKFNNKPDNTSMAIADSEEDFEDY